KSLLPQQSPQRDSPEPICALEQHRAPIHRRRGKSSAMASRFHWVMVSLQKNEFLEVKRDMAEIGPDPFIVPAFGSVQAVGYTLLPQERQCLCLFIRRWHASEGHQKKPANSLF